MALGSGQNTQVEVGLRVGKMLRLDPLYGGLVGGASEIRLLKTLIRESQIVFRPGIFRVDGQAALERLHGRGIAIKVVLRSAQEVPRLRADRCDLHSSQKPALRVRIGFQQDVIRGYRGKIVRRRRTEAGRL